MATRNEPQSYGSQGEWVTGKTGQTVNPTKGHPATQHGDFYESRIDGEKTKDSQGGEISDVQLADNAQSDDACAIDPESEQPVSKVTSVPGGARRDSQFKRRDYE